MSDFAATLTAIAEPRTRLGNTLASMAPKVAAWWAKGEAQAALVAALSGEAAADPAALRADLLTCTDSGLPVLKRLAEGLLCGRQNVGSRDAFVALGSIQVGATDAPTVKIQTKPAEIQGELKATPVVKLSAAVGRVRLNEVIATPSPRTGEVDYQAAHEMLDAFRARVEEALPHAQVEVVEGAPPKKEPSIGLGGPF